MPNLFLKSLPIFDQILDSYLTPDDFLILHSVAMFILYIILYIMQCITALGHYPVSQNLHTTNLLAGEAP